MNKNTEIFGIDISKDVFDVYSHQKGHQSFKNDAQGFKSFLKVTTKDALVVMEATGYYHYRFAQFLHKNKVRVSVVNPLSVKRFIQMKLAKVKTDKSDAKAICEYGHMNEAPLYTALTDVQAECLQLFRLLDNYLKKRTQTKNKLHGEEVLGVPSIVCPSILKAGFKTLGQRSKGNRSTFAGTGKTRPTKSIDTIEKHTRYGDQNSLVFNSCNRWF